MHFGTTGTYILTLAGGCFNYAIVGICYLYTLFSENKVDKI